MRQRPVIAVRSPAMAGEPDAVLAQQLAQETVRSERLRAGILATVFSLGLVLMVVLLALFRDTYLLIFGTHAPLYSAFAFILLLVAYEMFVRWVIGKRIAAGKNLPEPVRYWNAFVETSMPTALMIILAGSVNPFLVLAGPAAFAYAIFIVLSTLRLNFGLCVFTGVVAAVEFFLTSLYFRDSVIASTAGMLPVPELLFLGKSMFLVLGGLAAGFVTLQIRGRIRRSLETVEERNKIVALFGQQVSQEIVGALLDQKAELPSKLIHVCVMFLDIRDFSRFVEHRRPEDVVAYQNALFGFMTESVTQHHGIINQFLGDGFMATFGAPVPVGNECQNAVDASLEILRRLKQEEERGGIPPTRIGIGLHTGEVITGNLGSAIRKQYSITGSVVVLASRIEQLNKEYSTQLLMSDQVWERLERRYDNAQLIGPVSVKGRDEPVVLRRLDVA